MTQRQLTKKIHLYRLAFSKSLDEEQLKALVAHLPARKTVRASLAGGRGAVAAPVIDGVGPVVIKQYLRGGLMRFVLKNRYLKFGRTRAQAEFELLQRLRRRGIRAPEPVAFAYRGFPFYKAWLVTRRIENACTLAELSRQDERRASGVMPKVIEQIDRLIACGCIHVDLHPGNVLIDSSDNVFIIDFDKGYLSAKSRERIYRIYCNRWRRSIFKHGLPPVLNEMFNRDSTTIADHSTRVMAPETMYTPAEDRSNTSGPSILIILMGSLGDVARGLGLVAHIKSHRPDSRITWLVEPKCADLVGLHPQIDRVVVFERQRSAAGLWNLYQKLRQDHYDITLDLQRHFKSGFFSLLSRGSRRVGFHRRNSKEINWLFNNEHIAYCDENHPKLDHYVQFTAHLGIPPTDRLDFGFEQLDVKGLVPPPVAEIQNSFIAVVLGSSWESKDWSFEGYSRFIRHAVDRLGRHVVLLGGNSVRPFAARLVEKLDSPRVMDLTGNPLVELIAVLKAAAAAIGPDSGPGHLAAAVGTPYVTLFGPTPAKRHVPYGCDHLIVAPDLSCAPCYQKQCPEGDKRCMQNIAVEDVAAKICLALGE